jgi:CheY-like chemotaxis protein
MMTPDIFYVEDDPDFAFFMENAVREVNQDLKLSVVPNGAEALDKLKKLADDNYTPGLILLDMNLPGLSGLEVLRAIKQTPRLKYTPVLFFTTSDNPKDIKTSLEYGANAYLTKPEGYDKLVNCMKSLHDFWFKHNVTSVN